MEVECCHSGGLFNGGGMVMLEVVSLMGAEWSLRRWPV